MLGQVLYEYKILVIVLVVFTIVPRRVGFWDLYSREVGGDVNVELLENNA